MDQTIIGSNRRIDPTRRAHLKPDLTPDDNDRVEIGPTDLQRYVDERSEDVDPATINRELDVISRVCRVAIDKWRIHG